MAGGRCTGGATEVNPHDPDEQLPPAIAACHGIIGSKKNELRRRREITFFFGIGCIPYYLLSDIPDDSASKVYDKRREMRGWPL